MAAGVGKLKRMKSRLSGSSESVVEIPFEITCDCGANVKGVRRTSAIQKDCDVCGAVLFVLPVNVYPATPSVASEVIGGAFSHRLRTVVGELFSRSGTNATESAGQSNGKTKRKASDGGPADEASADVESAERRPGLIERLRAMSLPKLDVRAIVRSAFTPFRLVMLAIIAVVGLTGFFLTQQQSREKAQQVWLDSAETISSLLKDGDLVGLEAAAVKAVDAGVTLGKNDREWRGVSNMLLEVQSANRLAAVDLITAFQDAYSEDGVLKSDAESEVMYAARSGVYVFDSWIRPDYINEGAFRCELPAAPGRHSVSAVIPIPGLAEYVVGNEERRMVFAASIAGIEIPSESTAGTWIVELDSESFVLLATPEVSASVGFDLVSDTELREVLAAQDEFVRSSTTWQERVAVSIEELRESENTTSGGIEQ